MIPLGYMAKRLRFEDWLNVDHLRDIYSVGPCMCPDFCDYIQHWRHNGYWFFNSPEDIVQLAAEESIGLAGIQTFYYEAHPQEYDADAHAWRPFQPEPSLPTAVQQPADAALAGYDVVCYSGGNLPEHSPLSCNHLATEIETNEHCLLDSLDTAIALLENGTFTNCEPGPYRIIAVYPLT
jgi:hypothetical protein